MSAAPQAGPALRRWLCEACGLIYDEARGDPDSGLAPGTRFEDIPEDWTCPVCGVGKADFRPLVPGPASAQARPAGLAGIGAATRTDPGVVIVGAGLAGWSSARALRDAGYAGPISLVTACDASVYSKPALSVSGAKGIAPEALAECSGPQLAAELGVRLLAATWAIELDRVRRRLLTTRGSLVYRHLILATGAHARRIPLQGSGASRLFSINDLQAYRHFRAAFDEALRLAGAQGRQAHLLIIGAGLVGCEFANDAAVQGARVTLLDSAAWPLQARLDKPQGERLREALAGIGVWFDGKVRLSRADIATGTTGSAAVSLDWTSACGTAQTREFDLGLMATGIEAETRLAARAGLLVGRAIRVDGASLRTDDPLIYALGDCAEIDGQPGCTIEPIHRQAITIAGGITDQPSPFEHRAPVWVVKTPCCPIVIRASAAPADARPVSDGAAVVTSA